MDREGYPYGHCKQIEKFGESMKSNFKKELGEAEAEKLGNLLIVAHDVKRLQSRLGSGDITKTDLYKMEEASGEFMAASKLILF